MTKIIIAKCLRNGKTLVISARADYKERNRINIFSYTLGSIFHYFEGDLNYFYIPYIPYVKNGFYLKSAKGDINIILEMLLKPKGITIDLLNYKSRDEIAKKLIKDKVVERLEGEKNE